jgi:acyl carrier protein
VTRDRIEQVVLTALANANMAREASKQLAVAPDAAVFSPGSPLDSLGLVALLVDIEDALRDEGVEVELSDARAMSQKHSPFRDVPALVQYIGGLVEAHS